MRRVIVVIGLLLAACGGGGGRSDEPASVSVSVVRDRAFDVVRALELTIVNDGDEPVNVTDVELRTDLFEPLGPAERVTAVPAEGRKSLPLRYGPAVCDAEADDELRLRFAVDDRSVEQAMGPASLAIHRLHDAACAERAIRAAVDIDFGKDWRSDEPTRATGTIVLDRRGDTDVQLESVTTAIVFVTEVVSPLPANDDIEVVVTTGRCDAHALTESKKTFTFVLELTVDGGEPLRLELRASDGPVFEAMNRAIDECVAARTASGH